MARQRKLAYLALLTATWIWGIAPPLIKYTLNFISPTTFLFYRFLLAGIILAPIIVKKRKQLNWSYGLIGLTGAPLNLLLLFEGIKRTSASEASVLAVISPLFTVIGGLIFLQEKLTANEKMGLGVAGVGILLTLAQSGLDQNHLVGNLLVLAGSICWAFFTLMSKKQQTDPGLLTAVAFGGGAIIAAPLVDKWSVAAAAWPGVLYMAIGGSLIAYWAYSWGVKQIEASEASLFTYLQPMFGLPLAWLALREAVSFWFLLGTGLIAAGVVISEFLSYNGGHEGQNSS